MNLNLIESMLKRLENKVDDNTKTTTKILEQTTKTNGRVNGLEWRVKELERWQHGSTEKPQNSINNKVLIYLVAAVVIALFIIAKILEVDLPTGVL